MTAVHNDDLDLSTPPCMLSLEVGQLFHSKGARSYVISDGSHRYQCTAVKVLDVRGLVAVRPQRTFELGAVSWG